jgi:DNA end-binding protein Ku
MRDGDVLGMSTMLFADEVVDPGKVDELEAVGEVETSKRELDIAKQLVDSLAGDFEPERYHDSYREQVMDLIERKAAGEEIAVQPAAEEEEEPVPDLMAALKASLDAVREPEPAGNGDGGRKDGNGKSSSKPSSKSSSKKAPARKKAPAKS